MAATASYKAVPSFKKLYSNIKQFKFSIIIRKIPTKFTVAPTGSTNLEITFGILFFSSMHLNVIGRVAALLVDIYRLIFIHYENLQNYL